VVVEAVEVLAAPPVEFIKQSHLPH